MRNSEFRMQNSDHPLSLWERAGVRVPRRQLSTFDFRLSTISRRRGVTILEVLFSILVTSVGLLGAIALFPVATAQARRARVNDDAATTGRSAVHIFDTLGMRRPFDRWYTWSIPGSQFIVATPTTLDTRQSYCIDSRLVVRNIANWDTTNFQARYFPYNSTLNPPANAPRMHRIAFFPGTLAPGVVAAPADQFDRR